MKKSLSVWFILLLASSLVMAACGLRGVGGQPSAGVDVAGEMERPEPPAEYAGLNNPAAGEPDAGAAGQSIYQTNCVPCHGEQGEGDGPAAAALNPRPQNLAGNEDELSDGYLYWRIAEGGQMTPFHSAMPAWKSILSEEQIWQVISYIRTLGE